MSGRVPASRRRSLEAMSGAAALLATPKPAAPRPRLRDKGAAGPRATGLGGASLGAPPERAGGSVDHASRRRPQAGGGGGRARDRDARRAAAARPALLPGPLRAPPAVGARDRRAGDGRGRGALGAPAADPPPRPGDRRGHGGRRVGPGEGGLVQPGLARRAPRRPARGCSCTESSTAPAFGSRRTSSCRPGDGTAQGAPAPPPRASTRSASSRSIPRRSGCEPSGCASGRGRRCRWPATRSSRCRRSFAPAAAWRAPAIRWPSPTFRTASTRPSGLAIGSPSRSSSCTRRRSPRAAGVARRAGRASPWASPASWSRAGSASLPFELTGDQRRAIAEIDADLGVRAPHAAPADGRGRIREDGGRRVRDAARGRGRLPGGADGADRDARRAARRDPRPAAGRSAGPLLAADQRDAGGAAPRGARPARLRGARDGGRDARADRAGRRLRPARGLRGRRAAPLRRPPAHRARRQGPAGGGAARPPHDRDADPADPVADRLRRSRRHRPSRAAGGAPAGRDLGGRGGEAGRRLRVHPRAAARGPPGVRRLSAGRRARRSSRRRPRPRRPTGCAPASSPTSRSACCTGRCRPARSRRRWSGSRPDGPTCWWRRA